MHFVGNVPVLALGTLDDHDSVIYARFENMCDVRSSHSGTLHVKVREDLGSSGCSALAESDVFCERSCGLGGAFVAESE